MLHAPTGKAKTDIAQNQSQFAPMAGWELHPHSLGATGLYSFSGMGNIMSVSSLEVQRGQSFAGMQSTHGNQAVLRMLQSPQ